MSNATCSFFIYYYLYYSYINRIYYAYTIDKFIQLEYIIFKNYTEVIYGKRERDYSY